MYIYKVEKDLHLEEIIKGNSLISYSNTIETNDDPRFISRLKDLQLPEKVKASENGNFDLHYLKSILVTIGWNKNQEIFEKEEVWNAKGTPEDKPFNLEHNTLDIIGHIIGNYPIKDDMSIIPTNSSIDELPEKYHILTSSVIYKEWDNEDRNNQIAKIIAEIKEKKWFVSMECLFKKFDYGLLYDSGDYKIVARNKDTAFLSQYLRAFGGNGIYKNAKIGRVVRDIIFSGKGLVKKPANPESIIFASYKNVGYIINSEDLNQEETVMNELEIAKKEVETLKNELKEIKEKDQKVVTDKVTALEKEIVNKNSIISDIQAKLEKSANEVIEFKKNLETITASLKEAKIELDKVSQEKSKIARAKILSDETKLDIESATSLVETLSSLGDEQFNAFVVKAKEKYNKVAASTTSTEVIDNAKPNREIPGNVPETNTLENTRKSISKFLNGDK